MIVFATLGPAGTNHELVTKRYIDFHRSGGGRVELVKNFGEAIEGLRARRFDYVIQCAVHPAMPDTLGSNFRDVFAVDAFISPSKELAILTRKDERDPKSIGLVMPATENYTDLSRWPEKHSAASIPVAFDNLLQGKYDSALVYLEYAARFPDRIRVDQVIGSPDDVWIVYGSDRMSGGKLLAWRDSPVGRTLRGNSKD